MKNIFIFCLGLSLLVSASKANALPILNQTGNLIQNGNFETGDYSSWNINDNPTVTISSEYKIDGNYSAFIDTTAGHPGNIGDWVVGLWQYPYPSGGLTASAWILPIQGQAHVGVSWSGAPTPPSPYHTFSPSTATLGSWQYLEVTAPQGQGILLMGLRDSDKFYVDGVWLNAGTTNLSPYAPQNGFIFPSIVPEPSTLLLLGAGLAGVGIMRRRYRK